MYSVSCFFCSQVHSSDYWDEVDAAIERCRQKANGKDRGELDRFVDDTRPVRCEALVPPDTPMEQERAA